MLKIRDALKRFSYFLDLQDTPDSKLFNHSFTVSLPDSAYDIYVCIDDSGEIFFASFLLKR